ncbi:MAG: leucyl aminopeptidase [Pseudomonadota bacterium]
MPITLKMTFAKPDTDLDQPTALIVDGNGKLGPIGKALNTKASNQLTNSMKATGFKGKARTSLTIHAVPETSIDRLVIIGAGDVKGANEQHWAMLGGYAYAQLARAGTSTANLALDIGGLAEAKTTEALASLAMGVLLRSYRFDIYKSQPPKNSKSYSDDEPSTSDTPLQTLNIICNDPEAMEKAFAHNRAIVDGMTLARDLVNQPANILGPSEFAAQCAKLEDVGLEVEILDADQLQEIGMHALLAVAQGSERPARVAIMKWHGAATKKNKPVCFIGKGVCFDTGGISIKPAVGMEQMKGDMAGAACVTGLMHTLGARKARINAIGLVGLVENMPSGKAQRPGDIISSLSGQSIEVLNTDAEGRLVLADLLTYAEKKFSPKLIVDLATLTGAILVALGKEHAGLFSNNDRLANDLTACGLEVGEKVWRMPLAPAYDKMIDTPNADMKNIGGRNAGSITAAQFLQRFVGNTPWAHLDVAGTAMASEKTEISQSWASGWGVRLLNRLVAKKHEK